MADNVTLNPGTGGPLVAADEVSYSGDTANVQLVRVVSVTGAEGSKSVVSGAPPFKLDSFNYPISSGNSSTTQLAAGASFTGTIESPQDQPSISILMTSDQPMTVVVRQFIDSGGTFAVPDIVLFVPAGVGLARSLPINGNFLRVIATNTGAATTTTFNLNVAYGSLGDADSSGAQPVTELPLVLTGAAAQTATVNNILEPTAGANGTNVASYRAAAVQVVSTGTGGTFIFEQSNDGTNWQILPVFNAALVTAVPVTAAITATASQIIYTFPVRAVFLRLRIASTITGGSIRAFTRLSTEPWTPAAQLVASNVAANLQATVSGTVTANIGTGSIAAGTNAIGDVGVQYRGNATGAASITNVNSPATPAVQTIKAGAGRILSITLTNTNAAARFLKVWNTASGSITLGTTAALFEVGVPPNQTIHLNLDGGLGFATAINIAVTGGQGLTNNAAITAGDVTGVIGWA